MHDTTHERRYYAPVTVGTTAARLLTRGPTAPTARTHSAFERVFERRSVRAKGLWLRTAHKGPPPAP